MNGVLHIDGNALYYEEHGSGKPLILLHGNGEDHTIFNDQIPLFSSHFRVIAIDSRGHGKSSGRSGKLTYEAMAGDIRKALELLKIDECNIIGFSDGGIIALLLALQVPEKINKMIILGANYNPSGLKLPIRIALLFSYLLFALFGLFSKKWQWKQQLMQLMLCHPHISENSLQTIKTNTLIMVGAQDMIRSSHTEKLSRLLKNSTLLVIKNCDHFVLQHQAEAFSADALRFMC